MRNGYLSERKLQTGLGPVTVQIPKVRARTGEPVTFRSALVPPYVRKTRSLEAALPWLYLKGVSSGEMGQALGSLGVFRAGSELGNKFLNPWEKGHQQQCQGYDKPFSEAPQNAAGFRLCRAYNRVLKAGAQPG